MTLYVLRYFPTLTETFVHDEIAALVAREGPDHVAIAAFDAREASGRIAPAPVYPQPHRWAWWAWLPALLSELRHGWPVERDGRWRSLWLAVLLRRLKPRLVRVHFAGEAAVWTSRACARAGVPFAVTVHAVDLYKPHPLLPAVLKAAVEVATISEYNRRLLWERHGVEAVVRRCRAQPAAESTREPGRLLFVGRNVAKKGLDTLLAAVRQLVAEGVVVHLDVISDVPDPDIAGVTVLGLLPHDHVLTRILRASAVVLPCRRAPDGDMDGIPVVLLEAMAAGVAVVSTPISGIPEVVDETVGWLVPPDDVAALVAVLRRVIADPAEAGRRGQAGRARSSGELPSLAERKPT